MSEEIRYGVRAGWLCECSCGTKLLYDQKEKAEAVAAAHLHFLNSCGTPRVYEVKEVPK